MRRGRQSLKKGEWQGEVLKRIKGGAEITVEARWTLVRNQLGAPKAILAIDNDITEKKKLEGNFYRAQRMESIGTLAGGIAHDLNNVLAPIMMSAELLLQEATDSGDKALLETVHRSAKRGAELIKQVLSFARGTEGRRVPVDVCNLAQEVERVVKETFPKSIACNVERPLRLPRVLADSTQLHQVLMNLCVNARDAMPSGGRLSISLSNVTLDQVYVDMQSEAKAGNYVVITIADTGTGIPRHLRDKIFEPFFTTKELGNGTGLGLSTCQGIVRSHGGFISVYSEVGAGTKFKVYIPSANDFSAEQDEAKEPCLPRGNGELVLVIDDEEMIREVTQRTLERYNYRVLVASNGAEGVARFAAHQNEIAVVLTDMAMPVMDGPAAIVAIRTLKPEVKMIGCSGNDSTDAKSKGRSAGVHDFLAKPYIAEALLTAMERVLKRSGRPLLPETAAVLS